MKQTLALVTVLVDDYDRAIAYYTRQLNFCLLEDTQLQGEKRWVRVAPDSRAGTALLLAKAVGAPQLGRIGDQTGGRVSFFLYTSDFWRSFNDMKSNGVAFIHDPREEPYGVVAVFRDLYGNLWDLIQTR